MVQIIKNLQTKILEKRINLAKTKIEFNQNYLPIRISSLEEKANRKTALLGLKQKQKLLPYEILAGVESDYLKENYDFELAKINDKYYWKERIIKAKADRKGMNPEAELSNLYQEKESKIEALRNKYYPEPSSEAYSEYEKQKELLSLELENKKTDLYKNLETKKSNFTEKANSIIAKSENILSELSPKLEELSVVKGQKYDIEPGVALSIKSLSMYFGGLKAVDDLSFDVKEGEIFGLIGPNGAGKTTVFNCITKFYKPTAGDMYFKNTYGDVVYLNEKKVHNIIKEGIVRTFQNVEMVWELNVIDNLLVAAHTTYRSGFFGHLFNSRLLRQEEKVMKNKAMKILNDLEIGAYAYQYPYGLPYGILKKIELARTLMANPKLIILDEPAAGLNDAETDDLALTIKKIRDEYKTTIFLVEHDMGLVMDICDTICAISFGKKLAIGSPKEIQNSKQVQEAYLGGE
jgi:branched-chain amino acid transport system ATP-binding protein